MKNPNLQHQNQLQQMVAAAQQAIQSGHYSQAEGLLNDVLSAVPKAWDVHQILAMLYVRMQRHAEAAKQFRRIVVANPTHASSHANFAIALSESNQAEDAWTEFQRAIKLDRGLRDGLLIPMAETLLRMARYDDAIAIYRELLDREKTSHIAFYGMARAYEALEDFPRALECYEHATGLDNRNAQYHLRFGNCLRKVKLVGMAAEQYYEAVKCRPEWLDAIVLLAEALQDQRRFDEAVECLTRALELSPSSLELMERKGYVYLAMSNTDAAISLFQKVLQQNQDREMAWLGLGRSQMEAGKADNAIESYSEALRRFPNSYEVYFYLASVRKYREDDPYVNEIITLADQISDEDRYATALNFASGKVLDDSKQWDRAFHYYERANRLRNQQYEYCHKDDIERVNQDISIFTQQQIQSLSVLGCESEIPIFIVGMPRSGTTLTEQIISSHPRAIGAGEVPFWHEAPTALPLMQKQKQVSYPECIKLLTKEQINQVSREYLNLIHKITGVGKDVLRITDKMPHNFLYLGLIATVFPNAKIVHCRRDPLDNCLSIYFQNFGGNHPYAYDLENLGHHYVQYQRLMRHWHSVMPGRIFDLNYEDLIADPEYWSRKLVEHVGLAWDDSCLAPHKSVRAVKTASVWQVRQPIYKSSVQRWKNYESHLGPIKEILGIR